MERLRSTMKNQNYRLTQSRKDIYSLLMKSRRSLSAKQVFNELRASSATDLVSVYRNLTLFNELGLAHKFQDGSFSICKQDHENQNHVHFINHCVQCGRKSEVESHDSSICAMAKELKKVSKSLKTFHEIIIQGLCPRCS